MRSLAIVWIATLLLFGLVGTYAQISYEPAPTASDETTTKSADAGTDAAPNADKESTTPDTTNNDTTNTDPANNDQTGNANSDTTGGTGDSTPDNTNAEAKPETGENSGTTDQNDDPSSDPKPETTTPDTNTDPENTNNSGMARPLIAAPDPELTASSPHGPIPATIDGREPWRYYSRNKNIADTKPRIAIILTEAGLSERNTTNALNRLPSDVTFAFSPYAKNLPQWLDKARKAGHESLMMVPMEPVDYPKNDPGRHTLLTTHTPDQILDRLHFVMSRGQGYVGIMNDMGSKFTANRDSMKTVINDLQKRGLMFLDGRTTRFSIGARMARDSGVPRAMNDRYLDNTIRPTDIDKYLADLESVATTYGGAVGIGRAYPITIGRIALWAETLAAKGIELVPITSVANRQPLR